MFPQDEEGSTFKTLDQKESAFAYYDNDGSGNLSKGDIRVYNTGDGYEVECASCHDPHGVPSAGAGSTNIPSFLRVKNTESGVCLSCHIK